MGRIEILTGRERRRRWSEEEKLRMLMEAEDEGIALADVARRHDVHPQQLYAWRSMFRKASSPSAAVPTFLPVEIAEQPPTEPTPERGRRMRPVEVTLRNGRRLRVDPEIAPETLARLVQALESA